MRWLTGGAAAAAMGLAAGQAHAFADSYAGRLEALTKAQRLNADLLSRPSATETLTLWCAADHLADPPRVTAVRLAGVVRPAPPDVRALLGAGPKDVVRYRHVQLVCGTRVLSEADNWYLPARLTPQMNQALDTSDMPFGAAVRALNFRRQTLGTVMLLRLFPPNDPSPTRAAEKLILPIDILQHTAVLTTPDGAPFSVVVETYTRELLEPSGVPQR
jgi:hypothetical protein